MIYKILFIFMHFNWFCFSIIFTRNASYLDHFVKFVQNFNVDNCFDKIFCAKISKWSAHVCKFPMSGCDYCLWNIQQEEVVEIVQRVWNLLCVISTRCIQCTQIRCHCTNNCKQAQSHSFTQYLGNYDKWKEIHVTATAKQLKLFSIWS